MLVLAIEREGFFQKIEPNTLKSEVRTLVGQRKLPVAIWADGVGDKFQWTTPYESYRDRGWSVI